MLREGNDRAYRFNRLLLDEADRTQVERADLLGQFISAPTRIGDFTNALTATWRERGRRRATLTRKLVNDLGEAASDTRRLISRATDAGRETVSATAIAGRDVASRASRETSKRADDVSETADRVAKDLRTRNRRTSRVKPAKARSKPVR